MQPIFQIETEAGAVAIQWNDRGDGQDGLITKIEHLRAPLPVENHLPPYAVGRVIRGLQAYFESGEPIHHPGWQHFDFSACTEFQKQIYIATAQIPHGDTRTYGWVARRAGKPAASRAVGQALRANPFLILVPCHRVVGGTSLGGFMGASRPGEPELRLKQKLISIEYEFKNPTFGFLDLFRASGGASAGASLAQALS